MLKLLLTGSFFESCEKRFKESILINPNSHGVLHYLDYVEFIDTSGFEREDIQNLIKQCVLEVLVYDLTNRSSLSKIQNEYLPLIVQLESLHGVIIAGNKYDLLDSNTQKLLVEQDRGEFEKYNEDYKIRFKYYNISCKSYVNISDLFYDALFLIAFSTVIFKKIIQKQNS